MTLTGSAKQIAWAESIRAQLLDNLDVLEKHNAQKLAEGSESAAEHAESLAIIREAYTAQTSASGYIEHRNLAALTMTHHIPQLFVAAKQSLGRSRL